MWCIGNKLLLLIPRFFNRFNRPFCKEDTYDKELGINLANTKAWLQYYDKLGKATQKELAYAREIVEYWQNEIMRLTQVQHTADAKSRVIKEELDNIMKDL